MKEEILRIDNGMVNIRGNTVLNSIYLQVFAGETLGIVFDNTEEKDALIQLLNGEEKLAHGRLHLNEAWLKGNQPGSQIKKNIFIITESPMLLSTLSIQENIFFTSFPSFFIDSAYYRKKTQEVFHKYQVDIPVNKPVKQLTNLERVTIELLKAVTLGCRLVVIANITGILSNIELETFFRLVSRLKQDGNAFIVIESFQDTLFEQTDNLLIVRNGKTTGMFPSRLVDRNRLYRFLFKNPSSTALESMDEKKNPRFDTEEVALRLEDISDVSLDHVDLELRRGEILKILYTEHAGADNLIAVLKGTRPPAGGSVYVANERYAASRARASQTKGIGFIEENPTEKMLFKQLSVMYNVCMPLADKVDWFWFRKKYSKSVMKALDGLIDSNCFKKPVSGLPPSVMQKIVYCKWLVYSPAVVVCIKPFSITDMQVNQVTEQMIRLLADKGIAVLIITSNWPSVSTITGNTLYLENGKLVEK